MNFLEHPIFEDPNLLLLIGSATCAGLVFGWLVNAIFSTRKRKELTAQLEHNFQQSQAYSQQQVMVLPMCALCRY